MRQFPRKRFAQVMPVLGALAALVGAGAARAELISFQNVFQTTGQSMWGTGAATIFDYSQCFCTTWNKTVTTGSVSDSVGGGLFGPPNVTLSAQLRGTTTGKTGVELGLHFDSGSVNAATPVSTSFEFPGMSTLVAGQVFTLKTNASKGPDSFDTSFPQLQAYVDAILNASIDLDLLPRVTKDGVVQYNSPIGLLNAGFTSATEIASFNRDGNGQARILPDITGGLPGGFQFGEEQSIKVAGVEVATTTITIPNLATTSAPTASGAKSGGSTDIFEIQADLDGIATAASGGSIPPLEATIVPGKIAAGPVAVTASFNYNFVDVEIGPAFRIDQEFELISELTTLLLFDAPVKVLQGGLLTELTQIDVSGLDRIEILYEGKDIGVTARTGLTAMLRNRTTLGFDFVIDLAALSAGIDIDGSVDFGFPFGTQTLNLVHFGIGPVFSDTERLRGGDFPSLFDETFALAGYGMQDNHFRIGGSLVAQVPAPGSLPVLGAALLALAVLRSRGPQACFQGSR